MTSRRWCGWTAALGVALGASLAAAQGAPLEPVVEAPVEAGYVGLQLGLNLGVLSVDGMVGSWYLFGAANVGLPLATRGTWWAGTAGAAYAILLGPAGATRWYLDMAGFIPLGWMGYQGGDPVGGTLQLGLGLAAGVRFLHASGFTAALKVPLVGLVLGRTTTQAPGSSEPPTVEWGVSLPTFYLAAAMGLPLLSVGYRF